MKTCYKCKVPLSLDNFDKRVRSKDGYRSDCKNCRKQYRLENIDAIKLQDKISRDKHKHERNEAAKTYYANNIDVKKEYDKKYYLNNKKKIISNHNEHNKIKRKINVNFRLRTIISSAISAGLKKQSSSKNNKSCLKYLDYTMQELKDHLEKQFEPWMTWSNWGKYNINSWNDNDSLTWTWQIDHIIPQSKLLYVSMEEENFQKCWALENLRPYSSKTNLLDGNRR